MPELTGQHGGIDRRDFLVGGATAVAAGAVAPDVLARRAGGAPEPAAQAAQNRGQDPRAGFEARTCLLLRDDPADDGTEPLPAQLPHWASPDIAIVRPDGSRGGFGAVGEPDQVEVTVHNLGGIDAIGVEVDAFVCGPVTGWTTATAFQLLPSHYVDVPAVGQEVAPLFAWTPTPQLSGHHCLMARVRLIIPPDTYADPVNFDPRGDRHVAQRNIHVLSFERSARAAGRIHFRFLVVNPGRRRRHFALRVTERRLDRRAVRRLRALGAPAAAPARTRLKSRLALHRPAEPWDARRAGSPRLGIVAAPSDVGEAVTPRFALAPDEQLVGTLSLERGKSRGLHAVHVVQVPAGSRIPTGGLTLVVVS